MKLNICTLFQDQTTDEMEFSLLKLSKYFDVNPIYIQAGKFQKGNNKKPLGYDEQEIFWRNQYLHKVPPNEWMLVLDSDEIICGALQELEKILLDVEKKGLLTAWIMELQFGSLDTDKPNTAYTFLPRGRFIFRKPKMRYRKYHDHLYYYKRNVLDIEQRGAVIYCIGLLHYKKPEQLVIEQIQI